MKKNQVKRIWVLGILFFLPVAFLLFLYPSTHNYNPLDIVNQNVSDLNLSSSNSNETIALEGNITILGFFGENPLDHIVEASNIKELVYDKFKGFKRFQIVIVMPIGTEGQVDELKSKINSYEDAKFWHYVFGQPNDIMNLYASLKSKSELNADLSTDQIFIIDNELNQRGRLDDRNKKELKSNQTPYPLYSYSSVDIDDIKNKMGEDIRILFTEYRQKRKGTFDSSQRRANDIKINDEQKK